MESCRNFEPVLERKIYIRKGKKTFRCYDDFKMAFDFDKQGKIIKELGTKVVSIFKIGKRKSFAKESRTYHEKQKEKRERVEIAGQKKKERNFLKRNWEKNWLLKRCKGKLDFEEFLKRRMK